MTLERTVLIPQASPSAGPVVRWMKALAAASSGWSPATKTMLYGIAMLAAWNLFRGVFGPEVQALDLGLDWLSKMWNGEWAGSPPEVVEPPVSNLISKLITALEGMFNTAVVSPASGVRIITYMAVISVVFTWLQLPLAQKDIAWALGGTIKIIALGGFAMFCIAPRPEWKAIVGYDTMGLALQGWFGQLAGVTSSGAIQSAVQSWAAAIFQLMGAKIVPSGAGLAYILDNIFPILGSMIMLVLSVLAMSLAAAITVGHYLMGSILIKLAIAFGPVLVPGIMFKPLNFLFDAWLRTIMIGGMMMAVGKLFVGGGTTFVTTVLSVAEMADQPGKIWLASSMMVFYGAVFLATVLFIIIAGKLDDMARSLISGSGVSGISIGEFRSAVQGLGAAASPATATGRAAGSGAVGAARQAGGAMAANRAMGHAMAAYKQKTGHDMPKHHQKQMRREMTAAARATRGVPGGAAQTAAARRAGEGFARSQAGLDKKSTT